MAQSIEEKREANKVLDAIFALPSEDPLVKQANAYLREGMSRTEVASVMGGKEIAVTEPVQEEEPQDGGTTGDEGESEENS